MKLSTIETGKFKLDGGAMFGVVPKTMWAKKNPADDNNLCTWSLRCLLIEHGDRKILVDTGIGNKQDDKFRSHFHPHGDDNLEQSIKNLNLSFEDITDVFITHFHFDHVGGAVSYNSKGDLVPTFPNATYWSNKAHYEAAVNPNAREKASFLKENILPLSEHGVLKFIDLPQQGEDVDWIKDIQVRFVDGHTKAMMLPILKLDDDRIFVYCADLLPSSYHISLPWIMAYDMHPLTSLQEKEQLLKESAEKNYLLFFEHDPQLECGTIVYNERGRLSLSQSCTLAEMI